jgi:ABC-type tungstate transport system permease subunit
MLRGKPRSLAAIVAVALVASAAASPAGSKIVILATPTSTQDSGLLHVLIPVFERQTGYTVKPIAVGTGQTLTPWPREARRTWRSSTRRRSR